MNRNSDEMHLEDLLDAALAGTFPASDPVSGLMQDRKKPPSANPTPEGDDPPGKLTTPRA